jgi:hypothetical protein
MFPTATSHGRGVDQLDPGDVSFSSVHRLARRSFLSAILPNLVQATRERLAIGRSFRLRAHTFLFLDQCGTCEVLQDSRTQVFREDGRAEYNRLREAGTETTSKMFRVDRSSTVIFPLRLLCVSRGRDCNGRDFGFFFLRFFFLPFLILFLVRFLDILRLATLESSAKAANAHRNFLEDRFIDSSKPQAHCEEWSARIRARESVGADSAGLNEAGVDGWTMVASAWPDPLLMFPLADRQLARLPRRGARRRPVIIADGVGVLEISSYQ